MANSEKPWLPELYQDPAAYEALFGPGLDDLAFYQAQAQASDGNVLELGCGTGRLLWPLRQKGLNVEGLDASAAMLAACRAQGQALGLEAPLHLADWRSFNLGRRFAALFLPFNGLQHLHSALDLDAFFAAVRAHLAPNGRLVLDLHLPQPAILARDPHERFGVEDGPQTPQGERAITEQSSYDGPSQVLTQTWTLAAPDGSTRQLSLALRQFFPQELRALLLAQGFEVLGHFGAFDQEPLQPHSLKQVLYGKMAHA
jgi:SAM-dependent methyltransferase